MTKYAIFIDIDGTLFDGKTIHPENIRAINEASRAGHFVFINTGRGYSFIPDYILECADFYGVVAGIGAHIVIGGKTVKSVTVDKESLKQVVSVPEICRTPNPLFTQSVKNLLFHSILHYTKN